MKRLCVFCGSSPGNDPAYAWAARGLGRALVQRGIGLVYGGAHRGLMGVLADSVLERGGDVIGVIPERLVTQEVAHVGLSQLIVVTSMHERKACMAEHADAFLALPGGFGTLDELMEVITWAQLGLHDKPIGLLDVNGYFGELRMFIEHMIEEGFVSSERVQTIRVHAQPERMIDQLFGLKD